MKKKFLTFDEQIIHLENLGLTIVNRNRLKKYLSKYNYENIINEFSFPFKDSTGTKFVQGITDNDVISLFNFDQSIRMNILSAVFTIEKQLTTSIAYYIANEYPWMEYGEIFNLEIDLFKIIFPKIKDNQSYENFKKDLLIFCEKDKRLTKQYTKCEQIPIWKMCMHWSLGTSIKIYEKLNKSIKRKIVSSFPSTNYKDEISDFLSILRMLNKVRNMLSHNKKIFDFTHRDWLGGIFSYIYRHNIKTKILKQKVTLHNLCSIIMYLNPVSKKHKSLDLLYYILTKYNAFIKANDIDKKINDRIKTIINF